MPLPSAASDECQSLAACAALSSTPGQWACALGTPHQSMPHTPDTQRERQRERERKRERERERERESQARLTFEAYCPLFSPVMIVSDALHKWTWLLRLMRSRAPTPKNPGIQYPRVYLNLAPLLPQRATRRKAEFRDGTQSLSHTSRTFRQVRCTGKTQVRQIDAT